MSNLKPYSYEPLPTARSIRLLRVPLYETDANPIYTLATFSLDDCPEYNALSYTWGNAIEPDTDLLNPDSIPNSNYIQCDSAVMEIPENLADFLSVARPQFRRLLPNERASLHLWVDAICINQQDLAERAAQVELMAEVYEKALLTFAWLGASEKDLESVVVLHTTVYNAFHAYATKHGLEALLSRSLLDPEFFNAVGLREHRTILQHFLNYRSFLNSRRWFDRVWVVQEVVLSKYLMILCGKATILKWTTLDDMETMMTMSGWWAELPKPFIQNPLAKKNAAGIWGYQAAKGAHEQALEGFTSDVGTQYTPLEQWYIHFMRLIGLVQGRSSTDPRDKIFAVLSMANQKLPPGATGPIQADYTRSINDIYSHFSQLLIQQAPQLLAISLAGQHPDRSISNLPSWVPDFTVVRAPKPLILRVGGLLRFHASGGRNVPKGSINFDGNVLSLEGGIFDTVEQVCPRGSHTVMSDSVRFLKFALHISQHHKPNNKHWTEAVWRCLILDEYSSTKGNDFHMQCPAPSWLGQSFRLYLQGCILLAMKEDGAIEEIKSILEQIHTHDAELKDFPLWSEVLHDYNRIRDQLGGGPVERAQSPMFHRYRDIMMRGIVYGHAMGDAGGNTFYCTSQGHIGMGPAWMKDGDKVCLLHGAIVPHILRAVPGTNHWNLIGETYLHDHMNGEMLTADFEAVMDILELV